MVCYTSLLGFTGGRQPVHASFVTKRHLEFLMIPRDRTAFLSASYDFTSDLVLLLFPGARRWLDTAQSEIAGSVLRRHFTQPN